MRKISRQIFKLLSAANFDTKKYYRLERGVTNLTHLHLLRPKDRIIDHCIDLGDHKVPIRIFYPTGEDHKTLLLFFHGGGWVSGSIDSYDKMCLTLADETRFVVVSVGYRLAPEHPFPNGLMDCYSVFQYLSENACDWGIDPGRTTLIGDSAGGNLAAALSQMTRDLGEKKPFGQILLYPVVDDDHSETSPYPSVHENGADYVLTNQRINDYLTLYEGDSHSRTNPYFSPIKAADLSDQPDTLIITAEYDPLRDEATAYGEKLKEAGNEVTTHCIDDVIHGFISQGTLTEPVKEVYRYINEFLDKKYSGIQMINTCQGDR